MSRSYLTGRSVSLRWRKLVGVNWRKQRNTAAILRVATEVKKIVFVIFLNAVLLPADSLRSAAAFIFHIDENSLGGSVEIFVLATFQSPQEAPKAKGTKKEGDGYEVGEGGHADRANSFISERLSRLTFFASEVGIEL
jgi:hypothetical protein